MNKLHPKAIWLFFFRYLIISFIIVFSFAPFLPVLLGLDITPRTWWFILIILAFLVAYLFANATYMFWRYELVDNALKIEKGIILKKYISVPYERIQNVDIHRGIFARILGLSDLHVQTAGYSGRKSFGEAEGKIPGLGRQVAEELREELVKRTKGSKEGI